MTDQDIEIKVPLGVCGGGSRYVDQGGAAVISKGRGVVVEGVKGVASVKSVTLDSLVGGEKVLFFHLDVEGAELSVLKSGKRALSEGRIMNIVWEFGPHRWAKRREEAIEELEGYMRGFDCYDLKEVEVGGLFSRLIGREGLEGAKVIDDWRDKWKETEKVMRITDIWCSKRVK